MSDATNYVIEGDAQNFRAEAIERSAEVPVVVDFWAEWCGPCRMLGPVLERLAGEYAGRFRLVKVDTERAPELAQAFGVRSIPAVFGLRDGRVVDSFVGALPESTLRTWVDGLMPSPAEVALAEGERLEPADPAAAEALYREALRLAADEADRHRDPRALEAAVKARLARTALALGRLDEARGLIAALEARGYLEPEAERVKAQLDLTARGGESGGLEACRAAVAADPSDRNARLRLAEALAAAGQFEEALATCLALVEDDRKGTGESARKLMLEVFQLLPPDSELTAEYRRRLAAALF